MQTIMTGIGKLTGTKLEIILNGNQAKLEPINGMTPWLIILQYSPRRWGYGVRFYPTATGARAEFSDDGLRIVPVMTLAELVAQNAA